MTPLHPASLGAATVATIFAAIHTTLAEQARLEAYIADNAVSARRGETQAERFDALASLEY